MVDLALANEKLAQVHALVQQQTPMIPATGPIKVGVDLGTSSIVLVVVDQTDQPIFAAAQAADVVRDGLVVNYLAAVQIVRQLKAEAEAALGVALTQAAGAIPPGTVGNNRDVVGHVIEAADMTLAGIFDEPTAAAQVLAIEAGAIVDVGGGTTGISVLQAGQVIYAGDEPSGGTQITLVLAGYLGIPVAEAEAYKRQPEHQKAAFQIVQPVIEKVATITQRQLQLAQAATGLPIYLVGGAIAFAQSVAVFEKILQTTVIKPDFSEFVTPLGIAMSVPAEKEVL
jgi:ethanolamine utilization protein EutJ